MLKQGQRYTAKDILYLAEVPMSDPDFWKKDIIIAGISIKNKGHLIKIQKVEVVLIQIGNKSYKVKAQPQEEEE